MSKEQRDRQKVNINGRLYLQLDGFVKSNPKASGSAPASGAGMGSASGSAQASGSASGSAPASTAPGLDETIFTTVDGIKMKLVPFNRKALLDLREAGNRKMKEKNVFNTRLQRKLRLQKKQTYRDELVAFWNERSQMSSTDNDEWDLSLGGEPKPQWRDEVAHKLNRN
jgi:hypothetical protein